MNQHILQDTLSATKTTMLIALNGESATRKNKICDTSDTTHSQHHKINKNRKHKYLIVQYSSFKIRLQLQIP